MAFQSSVPPSVLAKMAKTMDGEAAEGDDGEPTKRREDYKKMKELEEMRKAGTAPAMKDEEGKDINPHIPQYIMQAPWYFGTSQATLRHQRLQPDSLPKFSKLGEWYNKGVKEGPVATKYRKGACENCGALTHKKKDCLERPRKTGAKFSNSDIAPDEYVQPKLSLDFEGKRDRWNGYNLEKHKAIQEEFQKIEEAKKQLKAESLDKAEQEKDEEEGEGVDDEDKYADEMDMPGQKFETKQRITVRNLRIREDTAKYLYNLDVNSAHYDPKTRSMRENPFENTGKGADEIPYAGDNFVRMSGDAMGIAKRQMFAWEAYEKGAEVHLQADPTKLEMLAKEFKQRKEEFKTNVKGSILDKYGGEEHLQAPPKQLLMAQTEDYVEYSRHGTVIKGQEKAAVKSRYEEDVYINNHTSVWGSYWKDGKWGFKCCFSCIRESYCTGAAGKEATQSQLPGIDESASSTQSRMPETASIIGTKITENQSDSEKDSDNEKTVTNEPIDEEQELKEAIARLRQRQEEKRRKKKEKKKKKKSKKNKKKKKIESSSSETESSSDEEDEEAAKEKRIKEALEKEDKRVREVDLMLAMDERKRKYNSMYDVTEPTEEEMEAFRRKQKRFDDPMAHFNS